VFVPTWLQSKFSCDNANEAIPQLSFDPLSTAVALVEACPFASN
jgi:hypothetical protein